MSTGIKWLQILNNRLGHQFAWLEWRLQQYSPRIFPRVILTVFSGDIPRYDFTIFTGDILYSGFNMGLWAHTGRLIVDRIHKVRTKVDVIKIYCVFTSFERADIDLSLINIVECQIS